MLSQHASSIFEKILPEDEEEGEEEEKASGFGR
jgi:hypothetical protein